MPKPVYAGRCRDCYADLLTIPRFLEWPDIRALLRGLFGMLFVVVAAVVGMLEVGWWFWIPGLLAYLVVRFAYPVALLLALVSLLVVFGVLAS